MNLSMTEATVMLISMVILLGMLILLFIANYQLLTENRYIKRRIRSKTKYCAAHHTDKPWA